jgi:hypothetical protein
VPYSITTAVASPRSRRRTCSTPRRTSRPSRRARRRACSSSCNAR